MQIIKKINKKTAKMTVLYAKYYNFKLNKAFFETLII